MKGTTRDRQPFRPSGKGAAVSTAVMHTFSMHARREPSWGRNSSSSWRTPRKPKCSHCPASQPGSPDSWHILVILGSVLSLPSGTQPVPASTDTPRKRAGTEDMGRKILHQVCLLLTCLRATAKSLCRVSISLAQGCLLCPFSPNYKVVGNIYN